jgi:hypothetical protein
MALQLILLYVAVAAVKDMKKNINSVLRDSSLDGDVMLETSRGSGKKQSHLCMDFLQSIDQTGELTDTSTLPVDLVKHERNVRAERSSRMMDESRWVLFCCTLIFSAPAEGVSFHLN